MARRPNALPNGTQLLAKPTMVDLEAPHGGPLLFSVVGGGGPVVAFELGEIGARRTDLFIQSAALGIGDGVGSSGLI
jgi:hypothetical protein